MSHSSHQFVLQWATRSNRCICFPYFHPSSHSKLTLLHCPSTSRSKPYTLRLTIHYSHLIPSSNPSYHHIDGISLRGPPISLGRKPSNKYGLDSLTGKLRCPPKLLSVNARQMALWSSGHPRQSLLNTAVVV